MRTTAKHLRIFQRYVAEWQRTLGLTDYSIYVLHEHIKDVYADTRCDVDGRTANIRLSTEWDARYTPTNAQLRKIALHEMLHVLLAELFTVAQERFTTSDAGKRAEHAVVRRLEQAMLPPIELPS